MPPTAASLLAPHGPVEPDLYPDDAPPPATGEGTVLGRLTVYVDRAVATVAAVPAETVRDAEAAIRAYALHLAFGAAYVIKTAKHISVDQKTMGLESVAYHYRQMEELRGERDRWHAEFKGQIVHAVNPNSAQGTSTSTPTRIIWG